MPDHANIVMPESDDRALCISISQPITQEWFNSNMNRLARMLEDKGEIRFLVYYKEYKGWEEEAARDDAAAYIKTGRHFVKFAYVNPPGKTLLRHKMRLPMFGGEFRVFSAEEIDTAIGWVKE
jgi:hypothetical protein